MTGEAKDLTDVLEAAMRGGLHRYTAAAGEIAFPAVPGLLDHYLTVLTSLFETVGRKVEEPELGRVRTALRQALDEARAVSPFSKVSIKYKTLPRSRLGYKVTVRRSTMADQYAQWVENRKPPLFGSHPDAKPLQVARSLGAPETVTILDVGAGTGRNTIPLAKLGFATDAVELAPPLIALLHKELQQAGLDRVRVFEGDLFAPDLGLPSHYYRMLLLAEVVPHFNQLSQLRQLFESAHGLLTPGGLLVFNTFVSEGDYVPSEVVRHLSQAAWCSLFTREDLAGASAGLPFQLVSDESVMAFERAHLPESAWPPTGWFEQWASGQDLFEMPGQKPPVELRWLVYRVIGDRK